MKHEEDVLSLASSPDGSRSSASKDKMIASGGVSGKPIEHYRGTRAYGSGDQG
jgi:hypothetical protein